MVGSPRRRQQDRFKCWAAYRRHLVRLWLRDPESAWPTLEPLIERWSGLYNGVKPELSLLHLGVRSILCLCGVPFDLYADLYWESEITGEDVEWTKYFIARESAGPLLAWREAIEKGLRYGRRKP